MTTTPTLPPRPQCPPMPPSTPKPLPHSVPGSHGPPPPASLPALLLSGPKRANVGPRSQSPEEQQGLRWGPCCSGAVRAGPHLHRMHHSLPGFCPTEAVATGGGRRQPGSRAGWALQEWTASELRARLWLAPGGSHGATSGWQRALHLTRVQVGGNGAEVMGGEEAGEGGCAGGKEASVATQALPEKPPHFPNPTPV